MLHLARVAGARVLLAAARYILPEFAEEEIEERDEDWTSVPAPTVSAKGRSMLSVAVPPSREVEDEEPLAGSVAARMRRTG